MANGQKKTMKKKENADPSNEPPIEGQEIADHGHTDQGGTDGEQSGGKTGSKSAAKKKQSSGKSPKKGSAKSKTEASSPAAGGGGAPAAPSSSPSDSQALEKRSLSVSKKRQMGSSTGASGSPFSHGESGSPVGEDHHEPGLSRKGSSGNFSSGQHQPQQGSEGAHHHPHAAAAAGARHSFHQEHSWSHLRHHVVHNPRRRGSKHRHHGGPDGDHHGAPAPRDALPSVDKEKCLTAYHTHHDLLSSPWGVHQLLSECGLSVSPPLLEYFLKEVGLSPEPKDEDRFFLTAEKFLDIVALLRTNLPVIQSSYFDSDEQLLELACDGLGADEQHRTNLSALVDTFNSFSLSTEPLKVFEVRKQAKVLQGKGGVVEDPQQTSVPFETLSKLLNIEISERNQLNAQGAVPTSTGGNPGGSNQRGMSIFQAATRKGSNSQTPKTGSLTPGGHGTSILVPPGRLGSFLKSSQQQRQSFVVDLDRNSSLQRMKSNSRVESDEKDLFGPASMNVRSAGPSLSPFEFPMTPPVQGLTPAQSHLLPQQQGNTSSTNTSSQGASMLPPKAINLSASGREKQLGLSTGSVRHSVIGLPPTANSTVGAGGSIAKRRATLSPAGGEDTQSQSMRSNQQQDSNNQSTRSFHTEFSGLGHLSESLQTSLAPSPVRAGARGSIRGASSPVGSDGRKSSLDSNDESFVFGGQPSGGGRAQQHQANHGGEEETNPLGEERRLTLSEQLSNILKRKREARESRNRPWTVDPHLNPIQRSDDMERLKPYKSHSNRIPEEIFLQMSSKIRMEVLDSVDQGRLRQRLQSPPVHRGTDYPSPKRLPLIESSGCFRSPNPHGMEKLPTQVQRWVRSSI